MASSGFSKLSKEEYRKLKDLEAARKAGTAPAELDDEGKEINPHIPQYMVSAPWYLDSGKPTLKHQRTAIVKPLYASIEDERKLKVINPNPTKYRKGACTNCGSMTHSKKECVERPRKIGAKYTNKDIKADEIKIEPLLDYDGKRDRWHGYDANLHSENTKFSEYLQKERTKLKGETSEKTTKNTEDLKTEDVVSKLDAAATEDSDDEKYADKMEVRGQTADIRTRTIYKNLRVREDTAKYLRNLDVESAFYDPKSRSMRANPYGDKVPEDVDYLGDNFLRYSGDSGKVMNLQLFAWQNYSQAVSTDETQHTGQPNISVLGNPTLGEMKYNQHKETQQKTKSSIKQSILNKYGGAEHLVSNISNSGIIPRQSEEYVEYCGKSGKVIKGREAPIPRSKYEEDFMLNNHTAIFGSYWESGRWGYKCCHSFVKGSYCVPISSLVEEK